MVEVTIHYFAESQGTIYETPLIPVELEVPPSFDVGNLKYMICYAADFVEEMMALMIPKNPTSEEYEFFSACGNLSVPECLEVQV